MTIKRSTGQGAEPRRVTPRVWQGLAAGGVLALAATPALAQTAPYLLPAQQGGMLWLAQAEGGEGGEGGEAGGVASGDPTVDFLANLLQVEGHLTSGFALLEAGDGLDSTAHMGHPAAEVYEALEHELEELGLPQFEDLLEDLSTAAAEGKDAATLQDLHARILTQTEAAWQAASADEPADAFKAIQHVVLKAGTEWSEGVVDGAIVELHEYQDAWGFIQAARAHAAVLAKSGDANVAAAAEATLTALADLDEALPAVLPEGAIGGDSSLFAATAARIELAAFKVK